MGETEYKTVAICEVIALADLSEVWQGRALQPLTKQNLAGRLRVQDRGNLPSHRACKIRLSGSLAQETG